VKKKGRGRGRGKGKEIKEREGERSCDEGEKGGVWDRGKRGERNTKSAHLFYFFFFFFFLLLKIRNSKGGL
jgi:hypothetical protein